jgi:hypothetical protein
MLSNRSIFLLTENSTSDEQGACDSDKVMDNIQAALHKNEHWMAYNMMSYFLEENDVYFFNNNNDAKEFAINNISDHDNFKVINISSIEDVLRQLPYGENLDNNLITNKNFFMNEKNYEYLTDQLMRTGFGDILNEELRKNIEQKNSEFTLAHQINYSSDQVKATLHFKRSDESDMVFFNKYDLELKKGNNEDALRQTFYPNKSITLKEGYNLLDGRPVHKTLTNKEGEKYQAWLQLDFKETTDTGNFKMKQYHHNYGFDLEQTLSKYPIKELQNEQYKESLIRSLERGNLQSATFLISGKEDKIFLTPNLAFKSLNAFDDKMQKVSLGNLIQKNKQEQTVQSDAKPEVSEKQQVKKTNKVKDDHETPVQKKTKKQKIA